MHAFIFLGERFSKKAPKVIKFLEDKGNKVNNKPKFHAIVNGVSKYDGQLYGYADNRRQGGGTVVF